jgi:hypothetical protein
VVGWIKLYPTHIKSKREHCFDEANKLKIYSTFPSVVKISTHGKKVRLHFFIDLYQIEMRALLTHSV